MKRIFIYIALAICFLSCSNQATAANWRNFSNFTSITDIAIRNNTEVWASAKGGVVKYDKISGMRTFFNKGANELPSLSVERIVVSKLTNDIWIGTYDNGLAQFDGNTWKHFPFPVDGSLLYEMKIAADGTIWSATSRGIYRFKNGIYSTFLPNGQSSSAFAWDLDLMKDGKILLGGNQAAILDPVANTVTDINSTTFAYGSSRVFVIDSNHFAFSTDHGQLSVFTDTTETDTFHFDAMVEDVQTRNGKLIVSLPELGQLLQRTANEWDSIPMYGKGINSFKVLQDQSIWIGSPAGFGTLVHFVSPTDKETVWVRHCGISSNRVAKIRGTTTTDLLFVNSTEVQRYNPDTDYFSPVFSETPATWLNDAIQIGNNYYVATYNKYIYEYTTANDWQQIGSAQLPRAEVTDLAEGANGDLWLCGTGYIARYKNGQFTVYDNSTDTVIKQEYMRDIYYDAYRDIVWVGTYKGILKLENGTWTLLNDKNIPDIQYYDAIEVIQQDKDNNMWFGTVYGGLLKYDGTNFSLLMLPRTAGNQFVSDIQFDGDVMYVSDNLYSIWKYENGTWDSINRFNSPLADEFITSMHVDAKHNLWMSNIAYGVDVYNENGLSLAVGNVAKASLASAFPNPTSGKLKLELDNAGIVSITLHFIDGQVAEQFTTSNRNPELDLSRYASGTYIINIKSAEANSYVKVIKQ